MRVVDGEVGVMHAMRMKRTNLLLDDTFLKVVRRISGAKTYAGAVDIAMREFVRRARARRILDLAGIGQWEGDLGEMRGDRPRHRSR